MQKGKRADTETNNTGSTTQEQPRQNLEPQAQQAAVHRQILPEPQQQDEQHNGLQKGKRSPNKNNTGPTIHEQQHAANAQNTKQNGARTRTQDQQYDAHTKHAKGPRNAGWISQSRGNTTWERKPNTPYASKIRDLLQKNSACTSMQNPQYTKGVAQHNDANTLI